MGEWMTVRGVVATQPRHLVSGAGGPITCFRLAPATVAPAGGSYTVCARGELAGLAAEGLVAGDPVLVHGRLIIREWAGAQPGVTAELEADAIGRELSRPIHRSGFVECEI